MNHSEPTRRTPVSIDRVCETLATGAPEQVVPILWKAAETGCNCEWTGPNTDVLCDEIHEQSKRLRLLLTENTCVRRQGFRDCIGGVHDLLSSARDEPHQRLSYSMSLRRLLTMYRWNSRNFAPIDAALQHKTNGWGKFSYSALDPQQMFFILASGECSPVLVHFDQWLRDPAQRRVLIDGYASRIDRMSERQSTLVVLVEKELGPKGPVAIWPEILSQLKRPQAVTEVLYVQAKDQVGGHSAEPSRTVVLYDLLNTGDGLQHISSTLRRELRRDRIDAVLLYKHRSCNPSDVGMTDVDTLFDLETFRDLDPRALASDKAGFVEPSEGYQPFFRRQPSDVDPHWALREGAPEAASTIASPQVRERYAGQWVTVEGGRVVAAYPNAGALARSFRYEAGRGQFIHYYSVAS